MADALVLLVTASIFLSGFLSVRVHQDLESSRRAVERFDRGARKWVEHFREVDFDKAVTPFVELAAGLRPDPVLRLTATANTFFAACVAALSAYWAFRPLGTSPDVRITVGVTALLVQVVVVSLFEYDRNRVSSALRELLGDACDSVVHLCPYLFAPHVSVPALTQHLDRNITEAIGAIRAAKRQGFLDRFRRPLSGQPLPNRQEVNLVERWLCLVGGEPASPESAPHTEYARKPDSLTDLTLRVADNLLDATEVAWDGTRQDFGTSVNAHLVQAARNCYEFDPSLTGVTFDTVCWALVKQNCSGFHQARLAIGVFAATGETAGTKEAAMALQSIFGEYLAGRKSRIEVEQQLKSVCDPRSGKPIGSRFTEFSKAVRMWVKIELQMRKDERDPARRAQALLCAEELRHSDPAAEDLDLDRELRFLGATGDARVAERMWLNLVRGQTTEATVIAQEMAATPMDEVLNEQPLMTLAWAWLYFQNKNTKNADTLIRHFIGSPHVFFHSGRRREMVERLERAAVRNGRTRESFQNFVELIENSLGDEELVAVANKRHPIRIDS